MHVAMTIVDHYNYSRTNHFQRDEHLYYHFTYIIDLTNTLGFIHEEISPNINLFPLFRNCYSQLV
jgi:hypothetical protein